MLSTPLSANCRLLPVLLVYLCIIFPCAAQVDLKNGLIGCYPFSGSANDFSVSANHGEVRGAQLTSDRFGNTNSAYEFDGVSNHIEIDAQALQLNQFSYSLWVKPRRLPQYGEAQFLFSVGSDYGDQHFLFGDHYSNDRHTGFSHGSYLGVEDNVLCSETSVNPLNKWYHLVLVRDKNNYTLYIDNKVVCTNSFYGKNAFYGTGKVRAIIGARNNYGQASDAVIDDIHLYNRPLSPAEVEALFKLSAPDAANARITTSPEQVCAGDQLTVTVNSSLPATKFEFFEDEQLVLNYLNQSPPSEVASYSFPLRKSESDYELELSVRISFNDECFGPNPGMIFKTVRVKACTVTEPEPVGNELLFVPNAFSPNADGKNDKWEIFNLDTLPSYEIRVFSRWGEVVFESTNYQTPWDGMYRGQIVQPGVYTYKISSQKKLVKTGQLLIVH